MPSLVVVLRVLKIAELKIAERRYLGIYAEVFLLISASISDVQEAPRLGTVMMTY
jgi:hypothetical protein